MAACGMLKGFSTLFATLGLYSESSGGYLIINAAGDALFTFLPLFLGYTAAKKFGLKPMLGLALGAAMCYPGIQLSSVSEGTQPLFTLLQNTMFASPVYMSFFGIPIISIDYTGTVIPVILAVWFASKCEKIFNKFVPDLVKFFFVPMLTLLIALPVAIIFLGPLATFLSTLISQFILSVRDFSPMLAGAIVDGTWQILVIFGIHWGFIPVYINNIMNLGYDNVMMPFFACTFATSAVVLAIFVKTKDSKLKKMAIPNFISGIFGVTEPAIYGMLLPLKKPFIISYIAGAVGGAFYGHFNFRKFIMGGMGIFELPNMMNPDETMGNLIVAFIGIVISMAIGFILTMIFYRDSVSTEELKKEDDKVLEHGTSFLSPLKGKIIALSEVKDAAFSSGVLGDGVAILPEEDVLYSPTDAEITALFPTGHAIGLTTVSGLEILIHVGMDTVQLKGKGFKPVVKVGDKVKKGQELLFFDREFIEKEGYDIITPIVITNTKLLEGLNLKKTKQENINVGEVILTIE
ncbi:TPA: glucose PTS transporter subunit IIA [Enterococcus faecium]